MFLGFRVLLTGFCIIVYALQWYEGITLPAWHALIWVALAFVNDLDQYIYIKFNEGFRR